jgi:hypothetical protein
MGGVCAHHGRANFLAPCLEIPLKKVNGLEADAYNDFAKEYDQYWKTYFDPIALRIQVSPKRYRLETIVLPLMENSVYSGLALALGGKPEALDALPVPRKNIFSINCRFHKEALLKELSKQVKNFTGKDEKDLSRQFRELGIPPRV